MEICDSAVRAHLRKGFILAVVLLQLLVISGLCFYALEGYVTQLRLADNYLNFYERRVALEGVLVHARQPMQLIASLPCLSAQFYNVTVQEKPLALTKIIALPYQGECKHKRGTVKYGIQAIYANFASVAA